MVDCKQMEATLEALRKRLPGKVMFNVQESGVKRHQCISFLWLL
jgi:hypothetical protein